MFLLVAQWVAAQYPVGYYDTTKGASGKNLKTAMHKVIQSHVARTYDNLWTDFRTTDCREDGKVWDMYSSTTHYSFGKPAQGANYSKEGDAYNREHSFPKSWFHDGKPMYTDLFHLYPTDGYVNNRRSNYPFGETERPTWESNGGWSKLGPSSVPGYSGTVFEPNDEYKGDFARSYFYMATCYENEIAGWKSPMLSGDAYPAYAEWALNMLLRWAQEDPVSPKEKARNEAVYGIQKNRNPFIDFPGLEQYVWGSKKNEAFDPEYFDTEVHPQPDQKEVANPVFSLPSGEVAKGSVLTITCPTADAVIYYTVNGSDWQSQATAITLTLNENTEIVAYAQLGEQRSETVKALYTLSKEPSEGSGVYVKISQDKELELNHKYLIVCEEKNTALSGIMKNDVRSSVEVILSADGIHTDVSAEGYPYELTLGGGADQYTFYDAATQTYLALTADKNKLHSVKEVSGEEARWTVTFTGEGALINNGKYTDRCIRYNADAPRFAAYAAGQFAVSLFKESVVDHIEYVEMEEGRVDVYSLDGKLLRNDVRAAEAVKGLPRGLYIVGGVKIYCK